MNDPTVDDFDGDGIPNVVEIIAGTNILDKDDAKGMRAVKDVAGHVIDATEATVRAVGGQAAVDAAGELVDGVLEDLLLPKVPMRLPEDPPARRVELTDVRDDASIKDFLVNVLAQVGDKYQRGVDNSLRNANPDSWDGSELVEWGANRAGSMINDGAQNQYKQMVRHDGDVSVDVALVTPGAVLYEFTGDPNGSAKPTRASTAISLGDGKHIIDIDPVHGVRIVEAKDFHFTHAGVMPGFVDAHTPGSATHGVVEAALKAVGLEPGPSLLVGTPPASTTPETEAGAPQPESPAATEPPDDDRGPDADDPGTAESSIGDQATALEARAKALRDEFLERHAVDSAEDWKEAFELSRQEAEARAGAEDAKTTGEVIETRADEARKDAARLETEAAAAARRGDTTAAEELREQAAIEGAKATRFDTIVRQSANDSERRLAEAEALKAERLKLQDELKEDRQDLVEAERAIDQIETKARLFREAEAHAKRAVELESEAALLRDQGKTVEADARHAAATRARSQAQQSEATAAAQVIDEAKLTEAGLLGGPTTTEPTPPTSQIEDVTGADATEAAAVEGTGAPDPDADDPAAGTDDDGAVKSDDPSEPSPFDAPAERFAEVVDAHQEAADLIPDLSQLGTASDGAGGDPWSDTAVDDATPGTTDPTPDLDT